MTDPTRPDDPGAETVRTPIPPATPEPVVPGPVVPRPVPAASEPLEPGAAAAQPVAPVPVVQASAKPLTPAAATTTVPAADQESFAAAVMTTPVTPPPTVPARPRSRVRWLAALGIVALVVAGSAAAAMMLTGSSPTATVLGYVPADSVAYAEARLDLPGDQRQAVGQFLSHFPGFADQASLETKLDETLDRLVSGATDGKQSYSADIKPWFDGEVAVAAGPLPEIAAGQGPESVAKEARGLLLVSVKDATAAEAWLDKTSSSGGASVTRSTETYGDNTLTVFTDAGDAAATFAYTVVDDKVALVGDIASVKAAIDTNGKSTFSSNAGFKAATSAMDGASVGFVWIDLQSIMSRASALAGETGAGAALDEAMLDLMPDWAAGRLRVESDALVMDSVVPHNAKAPGPDKNTANEVPNWAPPSTVLLASGDDYGATLKEMIELYRAVPSLKEAITQLETATGMLGGIDAIVGWMGDTGVVVSHDGDAIEGGVISIPTDPDAANKLVTTLKSFATLGGAQAGISVREEEYAGTTITIVDLGSARDLIGMAGAMGGGTLPTDPSSLPLDGNIELAVAVTDGVVVIGSGPDFVKSVLDAGAGQSLADDARFSALVKRVGSEGTGLTFVDIAALRGLIESKLDALPGADRTEYEQSIKPFLAPLDAFIAASQAGSETDSGHVVLTVK